MNIITPIFFIGMVIAGHLIPCSWPHWGATTFALMIGGILGFFVWCACYFGSIFKLAEMKAFLATNNEINKEAIRRTKNIIINAVSEKDAGGDNLVQIGDLAYNRLGSAVSEQIAKWRDEVKAYNDSLSFFKTCETYRLLNGFIPPIPEELKFIKAEEEAQPE